VSADRLPPLSAFARPVIQKVGSARAPLAPHAESGHGSVPDDLTWCKRTYLAQTDLLFGHIRLCQSPTIARYRRSSASKQLASSMAQIFAKDGKRQQSKTIEIFAFYKGKQLAANRRNA
jgi:hypothetical protein